MLNKKTPKLDTKCEKANKSTDTPRYKQNELKIRHGCDCTKRTFEK